MTTPRLYLFDPNLKTSGGHYLGYAARVAEASEEAGISTVIVANATARINLAGNRIVPALQRDYWQEMCPSPGEDAYEHLSRSAEVLAVTMDRVQKEERLSDDDILFFPYVNLAEVMGLARWRRQCRITPRTVLLFRRDLDEQGTDSSVGARAGYTLLRQALADLHAEHGSHIRLFTDSDNLTEEYGQTLHRRFQTAPIPVDPRLSSVRNEDSRGCVTLLYLGDARTEKGYTQLPRIASVLKDELAAGHVRMVLQSNFNVPDGEPGIAAARDFLGKVPNVHLFRDPITEEIYNDHLRAADIVLLPYQPERYVSRTSGILAEAICAGVPAVAPQGTWLSEQIRRHGAGVVYDASDRDGAPNAVVDALRSLDELKARAVDRRAAYAGFHRPSRLVNFICGARAMEMVREKCLV
jgi:glycosyltransferase involved in cell wall biosynthesis